jgi:hypothetical protein
MGENIGDHGKMENSMVRESFILLKKTNGKRAYGRKEEELDGFNNHFNFEIL